MGGKSKQAQRTKNNVRPSSSGRSAELVSGCAGAVALFPTLAAAAPDPALSAPFALCIKKLNKKDPITKTKALQELNELVQNSKVDDVVAMLPNWTHFYKILSVDPDRKVRELTQVCHGAVAAACGRRLAPGLRALLPAWLQAQHDPHAPARARAARSLQSTFPGPKLSDAITFCREEVVTHLLDNLLDTDAVISKKLEGSEERAASAERVLSSSLRGLQFLLQRLPAELRAWLWPRLQPLLAAPAFWQGPYHPAPHVRAAWYGCVGALSEAFGAQWAESGGGPRALRLLLAAGDAPAAAPRMRAALQLMRADPNWYERLEKKEHVTRRIVEMLESGGWGEARRALDTLPQLLELLPAALHTRDFYDALLTASLVGLERKTAASSKAERQVWLAVVGACLRWVSAQAGEAAEQACGAAQRAWLRALLQPARPAPAAAAPHLAALLHAWLHARSARGERLARVWWHNVAATLTAQLDAAAAESPAQLAPLLRAHTQLLDALRAVPVQEPKKRQSIKFEDEAPAPAEPVEANDSAWEPAAAAQFEHDLSGTVRAVSAHCIQLCGREPGAAPDALEGLLPLLRGWDSRETLAALAGALGGAAPRDLFERGLRGWLAAPDTRCRAALDLTFLLLRHLDDEEGDAVFQALGELGPEVAQWTASECATGAARAWPAARRWLRGGPAGAALRAAGQRAARGDAAARGLLLAALARGHAAEEPLLSEATTAALLQQLAQSLRGPAAQAARTARVCAQLAAALAARSPPPHYVDLLQALFHLTLNTTADGELEGDTWREVRAAWQGGLLALAPPLRDELTARLAAAARAHLHHLEDEVPLERIEQAATLLPHLESAEAGAGALCELAARALPAEDARQAALPHALRHACLAARLHLPLPAADEVHALQAGDPPERGALARWLRGLLARACFLRAALRHATPGAALLADPQLALYFADLLYDHAVLRDLLDGYAFWIHYELIETSERKLSAIVEDVIAECPADARREVLSALTQAAAAHGRHWAYARAHYCRLIAEPAQSSLDLELTGLEDALTGDGFFHTLQADASVAAAEGSESAEIAWRCAHLLSVRALLAAGVAGPAALAAAAAAPALDVLLDAHYTHKHNMLFDTDISGAEWTQCVCVASVCEALRAAVVARGWELGPHHWDFVTIALSSLLTSLDMARDHWDTTKVALVGRAVLRLYCAAERFVSGVRAECERRQPSEHVAALPAEWADVFAPHVTRALLRLLLHVLEARGSEATVTVGGARMLSELARGVQRVRWQQLGAARGELPAGRLARAASRVLAAPAHHGYKYLAYYTLHMLAEPLVLEDAEKLRAWNAGDEGGTAAARPEFALAYLHDDLLRLQDLVDAALAHLKVGEQTCSLRAGSDAHRLALGWLLALDALHAQEALRQPELALHYLELHRAHGYSRHVLPAALRLLPPELHAALDPGDQSPLPAAAKEYFVRAPELCVDEAMSAEVVPRLACRGLFACVAGSGRGAARGWCGAAAARAARAALRLVRAYVTPVLVRAQLSEVHERAGELEDTEVRVLWSAGEVVCSVCVEERHVELTVRLADEHPLGLPRLQAPRAHQLSPAPATHWLQLYLAYQNGSLLRALRMWAAGVSARVAAAPHCYICYCRLHPTSARLPAVPCHQCGNRFHSACLRKWFTSSNKSNCPLCRSNF